MNKAKRCIILLNMFAVFMLSSCSISKKISDDESDNQILEFESVINPQSDEMDKTPNQETIETDTGTESSSSAPEPDIFESPQETALKSDTIEPPQETSTIEEIRYFVPDGVSKVDRRNPQAWSQRFVGGSSYIAVYKNTVYFISDDCDKIIKQNEEMGEAVFYSSNIGKIHNIYIYESWLYFQIYSKPIICRIHLEDGSFETVFDIEKADYFESLELGGLSLYDIWGFTLHNNILYIMASTSYYGYNINSDELFLLYLDVYSGAFLDNKFYYIEHGGRTFSIYVTDLETGETELVRGAGTTVEFGEDTTGRKMYYDLAALNGNLFYREGCDVYLYREDGNDILVKDFSTENGTTHFSFGTDRSYLYFTIDYPNVIYKYDPIEGKLTMIEK